MAKTTLKIEPRQVTGKAVKKLIHQGTIPGNIFGKNVPSLSVQVKATDFNRTYDQAGETQVVYLQLPEETTPRPVLITNISVNPVSDAIIHIDFHQVDLKEKVTANIPVELIGESPAVKDFQGTIITSLSEIEVEALPTDLLENIEIDLSVLKNIGDVIKIADLQIDRTKLEVKDDPETVIVSVAGQQAEEVIAPPTPIEAEAVSIEAGKTETPPQGGAKPVEEKTTPNSK
jgi:large subunit ribosomal protein L25